MPTQATAERPRASLHTLLSGTMPLGANVLRNAILPEKLPAAGEVILRDGDPGQPEVWLLPPGYYSEHRAEIEVVVDGGAVIPMDAENLGYWLKTTFGQPTTTGTTPRTNTFQLGSFTHPRLQTQ